MISAQRALELAVSDEKVRVLLDKIVADITRQATKGLTCLILEESIDFPDAVISTLRNNGYDVKEYPYRNCGIGTSTPMMIRIGW